LIPEGTNIQAVNCWNFDSEPTGISRKVRKSSSRADQSNQFPAIRWTCRRTHLTLGTNFYVRTAKHHQPPLALFPGSAYISVVKVALILTTCLLLHAAVFGQRSSAYRIIDSSTDSDGIPTTAAKLCFGPVPTEQCYTPPAQNPPFGLGPKAQEIQIATGERAVLFTAESFAGGSGSLTILALLVERAGVLENLLPKVTVTNQSEYQLWKLPRISADPILVTADYLWRDGETHFAAHRYRITVYLYDNKASRYSQRDQFATKRKYPGLDDVDSVKVLGPEKAAIIARLK
jgi:hypothetical protein